MPAQLSFADLRPRRGPRIAVLPDAARVEERLLQLAREQPLVAGSRACSILELERELVRDARRAGRCPAPASAEALLLVLCEAARHFSQGPFFSIRHQPGYVRALGELLETLTQAMVEPRELLGLDLPERATALLRTLAAAREMLESAGLADAQRSVWLALEALEESGALPARYADAALFEFDGIFDWTPLRVRLAVALSRRARVKVRLPWAAGRPELTCALEPALRALEQLEGGPELELYDPAEGPLLPVLRALFAENAAAEAAPLELVSCASPAAQAREVARHCAEQLAGGARPESIAVAARSLAGGVAEELGAALERAGIPWRRRGGAPAISAPPVRLALQLLRLADDDFPRESLIEVLSSKLLRLDEDGDRLPPQALARTLREAHARDDLNGGFCASLRRLRERLRHKGLDTAEVEETERRVRRLIDAVRDLPERATLREHGAALLALLSRWELQKKLRAPLPAEAGVGIAQAAAAAQARDQLAARLLEGACAGLAQAAAQLRLGERRCDRAEFAQFLSQAMGRESLPSGGARGGAVQIVELREAAGRAFDHLLVVGLVEGELPARPAVDPLLSDEEKRAVNQALRRPVFRIGSRDAQEALLFTLALASTRKSAALLWPRSDAQGRTALRSPFVEEAARAMGASAQAAVPLAAVARSEDCAGAGELLARVALDALADPAFRVTPPAPAQDARALAAAVMASPLSARLLRIARAVQAERERVRVFVGEIPAGRFSGQLSGAALEKASSLFAFGADAPASSNRLEEHANCGFRTFGHRVLHLRVDEDDDDELGARKRGSILHECLERFFRQARVPLRGDENELALLRRIAAEQMEAFAASEHVGHPALWELRKEELLEQLVSVVQAPLGGAPLELERSFGYAEQTSWPALRIGEVHLRGRIDRIDRLPDGSLLVLDYKSGAKKSLDAKLKAEALFAPEFQLSIYAALVQEREAAARVSAAYVSLKDATQSKAIRPPAAEALAKAVMASVEEMRSGKFVARPLSCDYCELLPVCRLVAVPTDPDENGGEVVRAG